MAPERTTASGAYAALPHSENGQNDAAERDEGKSMWVGAREAELCRTSKGELLQVGYG